MLVDGRPFASRDVVRPLLSLPSSRCLTYAPAQGASWAYCLACQTLRGSGALLMCRRRLRLVSGANRRVVGISLILPLVVALGVSVRARRCRRHRASIRQRVIVAPLLLSPRARPSAVYRRVASALSSALTRTHHFRVDPLSVSAKRLGREGRRLRTRYWSKVSRGTRLLKLSVTEGVLSVLVFNTRRRKPVWRWRGHLQPRRDGWRHLTQRLVDRLERFFFGRRTYSSTRIAFVQGAGKRSSVFVMDYDGGALRRVSPRGHESVLPAWSSRGELTFTSYLWKNPDLFIIRGGRSSRLSRYPGLNTGASWSPDGEKLALTLSRDGNSEIYLLDRRGKVLRRLTHHRAIDTSPSWSPDGQKIAFVSSRGGSPQLWIVGAQGGRPRQLTTRGTYNQEPAWNPIAGSPWIAFTHQRDRGGYDIRLVNAKSGVVRRLTGRGDAKGPAWSPDGRFLLYSVSRRGLWIVHIDGHCPRRIYRGRARTPAWSPF